MSLLFLLLASSPLHAVKTGTTVKESGESQWIKLDGSGRLLYRQDERGNRLPDFSYVGYRFGERAIPEVPVRVTLEPGMAEGDHTELIQGAVDRVGNMPANEHGLRGAVLLKAGKYTVAGRLYLRRGGVVLRGEGRGEDGTTIVATGYGDKKHKRTLIEVGGRAAGPMRRLNERSATRITGDYVPIGARQFTVESPTGYSVGDAIIVYRPGTQEWISHIGTDQISADWTRIWNTKWVAPGEGEPAGFYYQRRGLSRISRVRPKAGESWKAFKDRVGKRLRNDESQMDTTKQWQPGNYDMHFERRITAIDGRTITVDAPLMHALDKRFGGGVIYQYETPGRIENVGVEDLRLISEFGKASEEHPYGHPKQRTSSELHAWNAIVLNRRSRHTWVRGVAGKYFGWAVVYAKGLNATVTDCVSLGHASRIQGGRRYPFAIDGQLNLVQRCATVGGRHEFVAQARTWGPNVFVDCIGIKSHSSAGPHHRYAVGTLFDNVRSEHYMESRWRGSSGTGHGWAGTQTVFYNCVAPGFRVNAPPGGISWVIGSGKAGRADHVQPRSLYYQQVHDRLGDDALRRLVSPDQYRALGEYEWLPRELR